MEPAISRPPPSELRVVEGSTITIECEALGNPTPLIVWRLNWGHIGAPPRVTTSSEGGRGVLTIRQASKQDQGAYTCEAINSKNSKFATPDTIVYVDRKSECQWRGKRA